MRKSSFQIFLNGSVYQGAGVIDEGEYLAIVFEKTYHGIVQSCEGGILGISSGVVYGAAVEYESASVAAFVVGDTHAV